jgi:hydroxymethylpyrimidine/phosphomethylpyrimidine kinase
MKEVRVALTIAGSDSGGGAGIEADLKTFAALGVHGTVAITAVTAQNTCGVSAIHNVDLDTIEKQIDSVVEDIGVDAAKTGMLHEKDVVTLVSRKVRYYGFPLVVDPVMVAKSGARLLKAESEETLKKVLMPVATIVTPNAVEAEVLSGIKIESIEDMKKAAERIAEFGPKAVLIKGGHLIVGDKVIDILYVDGKLKEYVGRRIETKNTHGTGCGFSSAITAELAKGRSIQDAIQLAKSFIENAVKYGLPIGRCHGAINPVSWMQIPAEKYYIIRNLSEAVELLEATSEISIIIPEVQSNLAMALPKFYLRSVEDVAGIPGRIVKFRNGVKASAAPEFGASYHLARILLKVMDYDPEIRSVMNIKYTPGVVEACERLGLIVSFFDRNDEPHELKVVEGGTLPWGIDYAINKIGKVPDIIYDKGDIGKEPMIRVFGKDALDVSKKVVKIAKDFNVKKI